MLVVIPCGGLGNRLMALMSARVLAEHLGCPMQLCWRAQSFAIYCQCAVTDLFEGMESVTVTEDEPADGFNYRHSAEGSVPDVEARLRAGEKVYLHSYCFILPSGMDKREFDEKLLRQFRQLRPLPEIRARVPEETKGAIGVHVRQLDHWRAIRCSPLGLFFRVMDRHCERSADVRFFLATDAPQVRRRMRARYGARLITMDPPTSTSPRDIVQASVVDMVSLANARGVYHSYMSSFSYIAHLMSGRPRVLVSVPHVPQGWNDAPLDRLHDRLLVWDWDSQSWRRRPLPDTARADRLRAALLLRWTRVVYSDAFQLWPFRRLGPLRFLPEGDAQAPSER